LVVFEEETDDFGELLVLEPVVFEEVAEFVVFRAVGVEQVVLMRVGLLDLLFDCVALDLDYQGFESGLLLLGV